MGFHSSCYPNASPLLVKYDLNKSIYSFFDRITEIFYCLNHKYW